MRRITFKFFLCGIVFYSNTSTDHRAHAQYIVHETGEYAHEMNVIATKISMANDTFLFRFEYANVYVYTIQMYPNNRSAQTPTAHKPTQPLYNYGVSVSQPSQVDVLVFVCALCEIRFGFPFSIIFIAFQFYVNRQSRKLHYKILGHFLQFFFLHFQYYFLIHFFDGIVFDKKLI